MPRRSVGTSARQGTPSAERRSSPLRSVLSDCSSSQTSISPESPPSAAAATTNSSGFGKEGWPGTVAGERMRPSGFSIAVWVTVVWLRSSTARSRLRAASVSRSSALTRISAPWVRFSRSSCSRSEVSRLPTRARAVRASASSAWVTRAVSPPTARSAAASRPAAARTSGWPGPRVAESRSNSRRASSRATRCATRLAEPSAVRSALPAPMPRAAPSRASAPASVLRASARSAVRRLICSVCKPALTPRVSPDCMRSSAICASFRFTSWRSCAMRPSSQSFARRTASNFASS